MPEEHHASVDDLESASKITAVVRDDQIIGTTVKQPEVNGLDAGVLEAQYSLGLQSLPSAEEKQG